MHADIGVKKQIEIQLRIAGLYQEKFSNVAEAIKALYPSIEMLRCVSSGTEATMSALRVARGFTGRSVIVKFLISEKSRFHTPGPISRFRLKFP